MLSRCALANYNPARAAIDTGIRNRPGADARSLNLSRVGSVSHRAPFLRPRLLREGWFGLLDSAWLRRAKTRVTANSGGQPHGRAVGASPQVADAAWTPRRAMITRYLPLTSALSPHAHGRRQRNWRRIVKLPTRRPSCTPRRLRHTAGSKRRASRFARQTASPRPNTNAAAR